MTHLIPRTVFFISLLLSGMGALSQQQYYLYIQSGVSQPFYARIRNSIYSSSENGYMIVPRLHDSTYEVYIGFARSAFPEQHFSIEMNRQDQGFELRNLGERGWGLFNLQNMSMIANSQPVQKQETDNTGERKTDAFSQMLANVVNDSSILYTAAKPVSIQPARKAPATPEPARQTVPDTALAISSKPPTSPPVEQKIAVPDSTQTARTAPVQDSLTLPRKQVAVANPPLLTQPDTSTTKKDAPEKPFISKLSETKTSDSYKAVFIEQYIFSTDTVDIEIPLKEGAPLVSQPTPQPPASAQKLPDTTAVVSKPVPAPVPADTVVAKKGSMVVTNSDCKNLASDNDLDKLRIKLLAENAIDDKLVVARKYFKNRCFSVKQIKALTELFPSDETRYRFFDVSYPFVSDTENFSSLEELIQNDYYKNRFRAMIRK